MHLTCSKAYASIVKTFFLKEAEFISAFVKGLYEDKWKFEVKFKYDKYRGKWFYLWLRHAYIYALMDVVGIHQLGNAFSVKLSSVLEDNNVSLQDFTDRFEFHYQKVINRPIQECFTTIGNAENFYRDVLLNKGFELGVRGLKDSEWGECGSTDFLHIRNFNKVNTHDILFSQLGFSVRVLPIAQTLLEASYIFKKYRKKDVILGILELQLDFANNRVKVMQVHRVSWAGLDSVREYWGTVY